MGMFGHEALEGLAILGELQLVDEILELLETSCKVATLRLDAADHVPV